MSENGQQMIVPTKEELLRSLESWRNEYSWSEREMSRHLFGHSEALKKRREQKSMTLSDAKIIQSFLVERGSCGDGVAQPLGRLFGVHASIREISDGSLQALALLIGMYPAIRKKQIEMVLGWKYDRINATLRKLRKLGIVVASRIKDEGRGEGRNAYRLNWDWKGVN